MLLILGIYENFTASLAKLSKKPIEAFKELWLYGIGTIIGIVIGTLTIAICLNYFPLIIASFFCWISNCNDSNYFEENKIGKIKSG